MDPKMTRRLSYVAGWSGVLRGLDFEASAVKLLYRVHQLFLRLGTGSLTKTTRCWKEESTLPRPANPKNHLKWSKFEMCFGPYLSWGWAAGVAIHEHKQSSFPSLQLPALLMEWRMPTALAPLSSRCLLGILVPCWWQPSLSLFW